jgi:hypothetical protein
VLKTIAKKIVLLDFIYDADYYPDIENVRRWLREHGVRDRARRGTFSWCVPVTNDTGFSVVRMATVQIDDGVQANYGLRTRVKL